MESWDNVESNIGPVGSIFELFILTQPILA